MAEVTGPCGKHLVHAPAGLVAGLASACESGCRKPLPDTHLGARGVLGGAVRQDKLELLLVRLPVGSRCGVQVGLGGSRFGRVQGWSRFGRVQGWAGAGAGLGLPRQEIC